MQNIMNIVIVGHVDHGKSTLIGRLFYDTDSLPVGVIEEIRKTCEMLGRDMEFAYLLDSLSEEREQNITIDTTQSFFKTAKRKYAIIDAPGHKEFLRNMITGAAQADAGVLIVSAEEGVQEQSKRHAYLLSLLGLKQVIVVINKMDKFEYGQTRFDELKNEMSVFLAKLGMAPQQVIPISAREGDNVAQKSKNMPWYQGATVLEALDGFVAKDEETQKPLRLPVQDVYKIDDKRILVGRVESGTISTGDAIVFLPSGKATMVKSVESFLKNTTTAYRGECIGITTTDPLFVERGEIAIKQTEQKLVPTTTLNAVVFWMARKPVMCNQKILLRCATQEVSCVIERIHKRIDSSNVTVIEENAVQLNETEVGEVTIITTAPIVVENRTEGEELGRFVLVADNDVAGGGLVS
ncbi:MAG: GTP-binding protein [Candidatus Woesearchaeota archaeon]|nr:GTP-binding protein [Candidatus Woesearchaeota archaeon]